MLKVFKAGSEFNSAWSYLPARAGGSQMWAVSPGQACQAKPARPRKEDLRASISINVLCQRPAVAFLWSDKLVCLFFAGRACTVGNHGFFPTASPGDATWAAREQRQFYWVSQFILSKGGQSRLEEEKGCNWSRNFNRESVFHIL